MKIKCPQCDREFSKYGIKTHIWRSHGDGKNHSTKSKSGKSAWNKGLTAETNLSVFKARETRKKNFKEGKFGLSGCFSWDINKRSEEAKRQGFGGYVENAGRSKKFYVNDSFGKEVCLQSSYELKCSIILNELKIKWIRPKHLKYIKDNEIKRYFPDFYLIDYDIYLDPKNDFLIKKDIEKIDSVIKYNNVNVYILSENQLSKEYIGSLAQR